MRSPRPWRAFPISTLRGCQGSEKMEKDYAANENPPIDPEGKFTREIALLRERGNSESEIQAILDIFRVGKTPDRHNIVIESSINWSQGHPVAHTNYFSWLNIDDFLRTLERIAKIESTEEKVNHIIGLFVDRNKNEMTVGGVVRALQAELKEREADGAYWERLQALEELLFINFKHAYEPNPIFIWSAYTLCRQIQLPLPPGLLSYLDGVGDRFKEIITEEASTKNPFRYALGMDQDKGQSWIRDARLFDRKWQRYLHPDQDIFINDNPISNRMLQRYKKEMKDFVNSKLSDMIPLPDQFLL